MDPAVTTYCVSASKLKNERLILIWSFKRECLELQDEPDVQKSLHLKRQPNGTNP